MTPLEMNYRKFEHITKKNQHYTIFTSTIDTVDVDMTTSHSIIEPMVNQNFGNTFQQLNGPDQRQHIHKNTTQKYQPISFQRSRISSIKYLK